MEHRLELLAEEALARYEAGQPDAAEQLLAGILDDAPGDPGARYLLGCIAGDRGDHSGAVAHLRVALETAPDFTQALVLLGDSLLMLGDWAEAAECLRRLLDLQPDLVETWNSLGIALNGLGDHEGAANAFRQAISHNPDHPSARLGLGEMLFLLRREAEAVGVLREQISRRPESEAARLYLALAHIALSEVGPAIEELRAGTDYSPDDYLKFARSGETALAESRPDEALHWFARAAACCPTDPNSFSALGLAFARLDRPVVAECCYRHAATLAPSRADIQANLGAILSHQGRHHEGLSVLKRAVQLDRGDPAAWRNLIRAAVSNNDFEEVVRACKVLALLEPNDVDAAYDLGLAYLKLERFDAARAAYQRVTELNPNHGNAYAGIAGTYRESGMFEEALAFSIKAVEVEPTSIARRNLGVEQLRTGRYSEGWANSEFREAAPLISNGLAVPKWDGCPLDGKTLIVRTDGGLGDTIQHTRFLRFAAERAGGPVVFACYPDLRELLGDIPGVDKLVPYPIDPATSPTPFDFYTDLLSLPALLGTTEATIPTGILPIRVSAESTAMWRARIGETEGLKVGICWAGSPAYPDDHNRSMRLDLFAPLGAMEGIRLVSLQVGAPADEIQTGTHGLDILAAPEALTPLTNAAAVIRELDIVISVDSAIAHLAGALGVETWLLLPFVSHFCWNVYRPNDTPWYPRHRLFRQPRRRDWESAIERVTQELAQRVADLR